MQRPDSRVVKCALGAALLLAVAAPSVLSLYRQYTIRSRAYRVGWEVNPPDSYPAADGVPTGLAVELVREAARRRGIRLEWSERKESSEAALRSGVVDLWPLMTITPERLRGLHISAPYLESVASFVVRADSPAWTAGQLTGSSIGYFRLPINLSLVRKSQPRARLVAMGSVHDLAAGLCSKQLDAVFVEQDEWIQTLMAGTPCSDQPFRFIPTGLGIVRFGVGATRAAGAAADAIRDELDAMSAEGKVAELLTRFGYPSSRTADAVEALLGARRRARWTTSAALLFAALFAIALRQTIRSKRAIWRNRRANQALREGADNARRMSDRLRLIAHALHSANDCICITDTANHLLYVNDAFLRTYEYEESELIGRHIRILRPEEGEHAPSREVTDAIEAGEWRGELWNRTRDGREFPIALATSRVRDDAGNFIALVGVASDISARKKAEEAHRVLNEQYLQAQKLESIGRLAGGVAHDFNNLLTIINGYSDVLLTRMRESDPLRRKVQEVRRAGGRAAGLTQQLLAISRKQAIDPKPLDLNHLIAESEEMLRHLLGEDIRLHTTPGAALCQIMADPGQIHQVLMNLVVNARDAMPDGGTVTIATANLEVAAGTAELAPGRYVRLTVSDTGTGMDEHTRQHLFEPFFTTKPKGKGTGLGLATVYGIVRQSKGTIDVVSRQGSGTSFEICFPSIEAAAESMESYELPDATLHLV